MRLPLAAILLLGAGARLFLIGNTAPVQDEYYHAFVAMKPGGAASLLASARAQPLHLLLDPLQTSLAARISRALGWLRLPAAAWGLAGIYGLWLLGRSVGRPGAAAAAALLLALSPLHIEWSRRVDFYALLAALSALHARAFLALVRRPASWPGYCAWTLLFLYSHPYALPAGAIQALCLGLACPEGGTRAALKAFSKAWAVAAVLFLPWFLSSASALLHADLFDLRGLGWSPRPVEFALGLPAALALKTSACPLSGMERGAFSWMGAIFLCLYLTSLARAFRPGGDPALRYVHLAFLLGTAAIVALDLRYRYFLAYRQAIWVLPFYLLAVADGATALAGRLEPWRPAPGAAAAGFAVLLAAGWLPAQLETALGQAREQKESEALAGLVRGHARPGDTLAFDDDLGMQGFLFTYDPDAFRASPGLRMQKGYIRFAIPEGLRVGPQRNPALLLPDAAARAGSMDTWVFLGHPGDLRVIPPVRRSVS